MRGVSSTAFALLCPLSVQLYVCTGVCQFLQTSYRLAELLATYYMSLLRLALGLRGCAVRDEAEGAVRTLPARS